MRRWARGLRDAWRRMEFRLWTLRVRIQLRRNGGCLRLDAPHGARLDGWPRIYGAPLGDGDGVLSLSIGRDVRIGAGVVLEVWARGANRLELDDGVHVYHGSTLQLRSGSIRIGARTLVRQYTTLKSDGEILVGDDAQITQGTSLHCTERIEIGDLTGLGDCVSVVDSDHAHDGSNEPWLKQPVTTAPVVIGRNVWVGRGTAILRGVEVGPNSVIGANSVLTGGEYPAGWVIAGTPAKALRPLAPGQPTGVAREARA
jgi:acetyltransferase-like isoleucine patch superfamily enzyme